MSSHANVAIQAWIPLAILLFALLPPRRAILVGLFCGWLFLPSIVVPFRGFASLDKPLVTTAGAFLGALLLDTNRLLRVRPTWVDAPILLFCAVPFVSSVGNGLGIYDGLSSFVIRALPWLLRPSV